MPPMSLEKGLIFLLLVFSAGSLSAWQWGVQDKNWTADPKFQKMLEAAAPDSDSLAAALFFQINDLRALNALPPLVYRPALEKAALQWAREITKNGTLEYDPDMAARIPGSHGELLAFSSNFPGLSVLQTARELAEAWYTSPAHRAVLLHANLQEAGCGVAVRQLDGLVEVRTVLTFVWGKKAEAVPAPDKPPVTPPRTAPVQTESKAKDLPVLNWGRPVTDLRNPRFFGTWTGGREAYRIDFSLESLIGTERPLWILGITRPRSNDFSALFFKLSGKKAPGLLTRFRQSFGEPDGSQFGMVEGDTEPARIFIWQGPASELKLFEGETHTYVKLSEL